MAIYVASPPPGALPCSSGEVLAVIAPDEREALRIAQDATIDHVSDQIEGIVQAAMWKSRELAMRVATMKRAQTYYTLGNVTALYEWHWSFPLQVYVADE